MIFNLITDRNKKCDKFKIYPNLYDDNKFRGNSQKPIIMNEIDIVNDINNGKKYYTKDKNGNLTIVDIYDKIHIKSIPNETKTDNIKELPITIFL